MMLEPRTALLTRAQEPEDPAKTCLLPKNQLQGCGAYMYGARRGSGSVCSASSVSLYCYIKQSHPLPVYL